MKLKNKKSETEKFGRSKKLIYVTIAVAAALILTTALILFYPHQSSQPKAAIIDQLSSSQLTNSSRYENQTFIETAKELLDQRFPEVDYYSDNATVDNYKFLPSYKLILWRAHSALDRESHYIAISTSEKYDPTKYSQYIENDQLTLCNITDDPKLYFAINPKFVKEVMSGSFEDTVIIFMSCNGLKEGYCATAETFIEKGVKVFISWDGWIDSSDNDNAIALLLQYLINETNTISEAVNKIRQYSYSVGYPPSRLGYYPTGIADYRIPNYKQNSNANNAGFVTITILRKNFRLTLD